jgi:serine/threonine protein kinase
VLSGHLPFTGKNHLAIFESIKSGQFEMPDFFSDDLKDLMSKMLLVDYAQRITLMEIIRHPWLNQK